MVLSVNMGKKVVIGWVGCDSDKERVLMVGEGVTMDWRI